MSVLPKNETPLDYFFVDDNQTVVEVRFQRPNNHIEGFIVRMDDPTEDDYIQLMKWTTLEELQRIQEDRKKSERESQEKIENYIVLNEEINRLRQMLDDAGNSKENWKKKALTVKGGARTSRERVVYKDQDIMEVLNKELNREDLFALKISIFEQPKVRNSQDKQIKSKIRKAKSTLEVLAAAAPLLLAEDQEENSE